MKFFSRDKWVPTRLNYLGYQPLRYLSAHFFRTFLKKGKSEGYRKLRRDGYLVIENFFDDDRVKLLQELVNSIDCAEIKLGNYSEIKDGGTIVKRRTLELINKTSSTQSEVIYQCWSHILETLSEIFSVEKENCIENQLVWFDHIVASPGGSTQSEPHTDVYFPNYKVWYFPFEVNENDIPLILYPKSARFSLRRMIFEFKQSITAKVGTEHSWRANVRRNPRLLQQRKIMSCNKNTLIIADVHAFHHRKNNKKMCNRVQLHATITRKPFERSYP